MMTSSQEKPIAVHVCKSCGAKMDRASIAPEAILNGIIPCSSCGQGAPLNLQVITVAAKLPPGREKASSN